jgi:3-phenylpropionate/trans-cinnamate dioxygenase ferredoxin reductase subunit
VTDSGIVIVGAGEAAVAACTGLRARGFQGNITLVGAENHLPYERPPLSKDILLATAEPDPATPTILREDRMRTINVTVLRGNAVRKIDRGQHRVELSDGESMNYDRLLIATGGRPRRLQAGGSAADKVLYLRTFDDALALRTRLRPGKTLAIIGGGFIGLEVAAAAITRGCRVILIERGNRLLERGVPEAIATEIHRRHEAAGVDIRLTTAVERIDEDCGTLSVLAGGQRLACDTILAGIGAVPETSLAADCGLEIENGIRVDATLRTSDQDIYAAGDCCSFPHPLYDGRRLRLEAWRNAQDQGAHVAGGLLGDQAPYTSLPWFWSDQYDRLMRIAGLIDHGVSDVTHEASDGSRIIFHLGADGRLVAASGFGIPATVTQEISASEPLISDRLRPDRAWLVSAKIAASLKDGVQ